MTQSNTETKDDPASELKRIVIPILWTNGVDAFVATDKDHLQKVYKEHYGETMFEITGDENELKWWNKANPEGQTKIYMNLEDEDISDLKTIKIEEVENSPMPDWTHLVTAKHKDWAEWKGGGFLCSTEW